MPAIAAGAPLRQIGLQSVGFDELQAAVAGEFLGQMAGQMGIDFNRDQASGARQQVRGQGAAAGADLDHQRLRLGASGAGDTFENGTAEEEMLAEFLARHR